MRSISRLKRLGIIGISLGMLVSPLGFAYDGDAQESQQGSNTGTTEYQESQNATQGQGASGANGGTSEAEPQGYEPSEEGGSSGAAGDEEGSTWEEEESQQGEDGW